jgi:hypothetical protein
MVPGLRDKIHAILIRFSLLWVSLSGGIPKFMCQVMRVFSAKALSSLKNLKVV